MPTAAENISAMRKAAGAPEPTGFAPAPTTTQGNPDPQTDDRARLAAGADASGNAGAGSSSGAGTPDAIPAASSPAAEAPKPPSRWTRKLRVLDEDREVNLETMPEAELDSLLGRGLSHETVKERLRAKRDEAIEALAQAHATRDTAWINELRAQGYERDPSTGRIRVLGAQPQPAAAQAQGGQPDLDALEKKAREEGTQEAWFEYTGAIRKAMGRQSTAEQINAAIERRLTEYRQSAESDQRLAQDTRTFKDKFEQTWKLHEPTFAKAGDVAALKEQVRKRAHEASFLPNATEQSVLATIAEQASLIEGTWKASQASLTTAAAKPRPKAPTTLGSGGPPGPASTDPAAIDGSTPEGRQKRIDYLRKQGEARRQPSHV